MLREASQAKRVQAHIESLVQLNLETAMIEGKREAADLGVALGLAILAAAAIAGLVAVKFAKKCLPLLPTEALNQAK